MEKDISELTKELQTAQMEMYSAETQVASAMADDDLCSQFLTDQGTYDRNKLAEADKEKAQEFRERALEIQREYNLHTICEKVYSLQAQLMEKHKELDIPILHKL